VKKHHYTKYASFKERDMNPEHVLINTDHYQGDVQGVAEKPDDF
jgi:hypothetical protein